MNKNCQQCNKNFEKAYNTSQRVFAKQKFCSRDCFGLSVTGNIRPHSEETKLKLSLANKNNKSGLINGEKTRFGNYGRVGRSWTGTKNEYRSLHKWVENELGKPCECSQCGVVAYGRQIHWANKSKEYKKVLSDWVRLCAKCHYKYDFYKLKTN